MYLMLLLVNVYIKLDIFDITVTLHAAVDLKHFYLNL